MKMKKMIDSTTNQMNDDELVGNPRGVNTSSEGFQKLKKAIRERAVSFSPEEKWQIELSALRYRMQDYVQESNQVIIPTGYFIKEFLRAIGVQLKSFASYINSNPGNVSKILNGTRKINPEMAIILGNTFGTEPEIWLQIQDKNEIINLKRIKKSDYRRYSLNRLIETQDKA
jgi:addiction module HigA family antidote